MAAGDLLHGAAEQDHGVGGLEPLPRRESEFALARAELDLDRAQRQTERQDVAPDDLEHRLHLVVALLGQILIAVRQQADVGRRARLAGMLRRHLRVFELEDVEFDLEPGDEVVAAFCQVCRAPTGRDGGSRTAPAARRRNRRRTAASRSRAPMAARGSVVGSGTIRTSAAPSISRMPKPPPAVNTGNTVLCEVSLANIVVVMVQPLSSDASASLATSVLPRRMPC